eukprot:2735944-Alexandrium_andersonii.AAC.1
MRRRATRRRWVRSGARDYCSHYCRRHGCCQRLRQRYHHAVQRPPGAGGAAHARLELQQGVWARRAGEGRPSHRRLGACAAR